MFCEFAFFEGFTYVLANFGVSSQAQKHKKFHCQKMMFKLKIVYLFIVGTFFVSVDACLRMVTDASNLEDRFTVFQNPASHLFHIAYTEVTPTSGRNIKYLQSIDHVIFLF